MIPLFLSAMLLLSCQKELPFSPAQARVMTVRADQTESVMRIADDARDTLPGFFRHVTMKNTGESHFCVKYPLAANDNSGVNIEHLWLTNIRFKNGRYSGSLANTPLHINGRKKGDIVTFNPDDIIDWMYIRGGKIIGGDSIKYLLEQTPDQQLSAAEQKILHMFD